MIEYKDLRADVVKELPNDSLLLVLLAIAAYKVEYGDIDGFEFEITNFKEPEIEFLCKELDKLGYKTDPNDTYLGLNWTYRYLRVNYKEKNEHPDLFF